MTIQMIYDLRLDLEEKTAKLELAIKESVIPADSPRMILVDLLEPAANEFKNTVIFVKDRLNLPALVAPYVNRIKSTGVNIIY